MATKTPAKKEKDAKKKAKTNDPNTVRLDKAQNKVKRDVEGGRNLDSILGLTDPLSRVSTDLPEDSLAYLNAVKSFADPNSEAFVGRRSQEESDALGGLKSLSEKAAETQPEEQKAITTLEDVVARAGQRSSDMQSTLDLMKQGLAGLSAPENQALREQAQKEVDRKLQSAIGDIQNRARSMGTRGGSVNAALRNARRDAMGAQADMEQKNLLANIDIQDRRRNDYAGTLGDIEGREFDQRAGAADSYAGAINNFMANRFSRMNTASNNYFSGVRDLNDSERNRTADATASYGNALTDKNNYFLDTTKINLGQERADKAAKNASVLGLAGLTENERERRRQLRANKRRNSGSTSNTSMGGDPNQAAKDYYNAVAGIYGQPGV